MNFNNYLLKLEKSFNLQPREHICIYGVSPIINSIYLDLKIIHKKNIVKTLDKKFHINYQTLYSWTTGHNPIPISKAHNLLNFWKTSCNKTNKKLNEKWDTIYFNNQGYSQCGERKVILPKELNISLGYLIGFFQGDGHLKKENKKGVQEYSIYFYDKNIKVLKRINEILFKEFRIEGNYYPGSNSQGHKWYILRISSKPIYNFFGNILNLRAGKKVREVETPEIIKKANSQIQLAFIRGFFDAGGVLEKR